MSDPANVNRFTGQAAKRSKMEDAEDAAVRTSNRVFHNAYVGHPALFILVAFILGGIITSFFTISSFKSWSFEHINFVTALVDVLFLPIAGGVLLAIVAVVCARSMRP